MELANIMILQTRTILMVEILFGSVLMKTTTKYEIILDRVTIMNIISVIMTNCFINMDLHMITGFKECK